MITKSIHISNAYKIPVSLEETYYGRPVRIAQYAPEVERQMGINPWMIERWLRMQRIYDETYIIVREPFFYYSARPFCFIRDSIGDWLPVCLDCLIFCSPNQIQK